MKNFIILTLFTGLSIFCISCKKYLDKKSDESLSIPETLDDLQALLDYPSVNPGMPITNIGTDEYYMDFSKWNGYGQQNLYRTGYVWDASTNDLLGWETHYLGALYANTILDNLEKVSPDGQPQRWNQIKGAALFHRAWVFYQLCQVFAPAYDKTTAATDPGIPLRLSSDFNIPSTRASVQQSYDRIVADLQASLLLLPNEKPSIPLYKTRPVKATAYALLARTLLTMGDYEKAGKYADSSLQIYDVLRNYSDVLGGTYSFPQLNEEVIFHCAVEAANGSSSGVKADSVLYDSYSTDDWRKTRFYNATRRYIGSYTSSFSLFTGLATDELYLTRAECYARNGNTTAAMQDLNTLLITRWKANTFVPFTASTPQRALSIVLTERKKQLVNRGIRWTDLRRLNKDPQFAVTLKRNLNGQIYTLPPGDLRYTWLIPVEVLRYVSISQNPR